MTTLLNRVINKAKNLTNVNNVHQIFVQYQGLINISELTQVFDFQLHFPIANKLGDKPYKCNQCPWTFAYKYVLKVHERTHSGFFKNILLLINIKNNVKLGEKPYKCDQCNSTFAQKGSLKMHEQIHKGQ